MIVELGFSLADCAPPASHEHQKRTAERLVTLYALVLMVKGSRNMAAVALPALLASAYGSSVRPSARHNSHPTALDLVPIPRQTEPIWDQIVMLRRVRRRHVDVLDAG